MHLVQHAFNSPDIQHVEHAPVESVHSFKDMLMLLLLTLVRGDITWQQAIKMASAFVQW